MKDLLWLAMFLGLFSYSSSQNVDGVFAFSWLAGHCHQRKDLCSPSLVQLWDNQSFTIHGLWPAYNATRSYGNFNLQLFANQKILLDDMQNYWPPQNKETGSNVFLWKHQWQKHGWDYAQILLRLIPEDFQGTEQQRNDKLQIKYFQDAINFYKMFNLKKIPSSRYKKAQFSQLLDLPWDEFYYTCAKGTLLRQLLVCFEITRSGFVMKSCSRSTSSCSNGGQVIDLMSWAKKSQERVFFKVFQFDLTPSVLPPDVRPNIIPDNVGPNLIPDDVGPNHIPPTQEDTNDEGQDSSYQQRIFLISCLIIGLVAYLLCKIYVRYRTLDQALQIEMQQDSNYRQAQNKESDSHAIEENSNDHPLELSNQGKESSNK